MKLAIIIATRDTATAWQAVRLGSHALQQGDTVRVFLLGGGTHDDSCAAGEYDVTGEICRFAEAGGEVLVGGTGPVPQNVGAESVCPQATVSDLYALLRDADRVLTF
ncbi:MAG TPA: sulfur reduction protein DsrE [bacterium]|nr:sulfur reduction protein DsrE [bacterium]